MRNRPLRPPFCLEPSSGFLPYLDKLQTQTHPFSVTSSYFSHSCVTQSRCPSLHLALQGAASLIQGPRACSSTNCPTGNTLLPGLQLALAHHPGPQGALFDIPPAPTPLLAPSLSNPRTWQIMVSGQICSPPFICILPMAAFV